MAKSSMAIEARLEDEVAPTVPAGRVGARLAGRGALIDCQQWSYAFASATIRASGGRWPTSGQLTY